MFFSSAFFPKETMSGLYKTLAYINPISYLVEGFRDLTIDGFSASAVVRAVVIPAILAMVAVVLAFMGTHEPTRGTMTALNDTTTSTARSVASTRTFPASVGLMRRSLVNITRLPSAFLPSVLMPIFQAIAFSGTFFAITQIPGFPTDRSINWFLPLGVVMGAGFAGIGIGFSTIRDLEGGFYDRLRLTPTPRMSLVTGPLLAALARAALVTTIVFIVGTLSARASHTAHLG